MTTPTSRIDKKILILKAKQEELLNAINQLEEAKKLSDLSIDNPEIRDLDELVQQAAEKLKTTPKKILTVLIGKYKSAKPSKPAVVKFRDTAPGCENNTWSGRGLAPLWLKRYEAAGRSRNDFLVK